MFRLVKLTDSLNNIIITGGLVPKGEYDIGTNYAPGDLVTLDGMAYVMWNDGPAGTNPSDAAYWQPLASNGADGADGADGQGVPTGGTTDQLLAKASGTDFDTQWVNKEDVGTPESLIIAYSIAL